jgi:hypothetical protein
LEYRDGAMRTVLSGICSLCSGLALASLLALAIPGESSASQDDGVTPATTLQMLSAETSSPLDEPTSPGAPLMRNPRVRLVTAVASRHTQGTTRVSAHMQPHVSCCSLAMAPGNSYAPTLQSARIRLQI